MRNRNKKAFGFTMIEVISVLVIIGILAAIAAPRLINMATESKIKLTASGIANYNSQEQMLWERMMMINDSTVLASDESLNQAIYDAMDFDLNSGSSDDWNYSGSYASGEISAILTFKDVDSVIVRTAATLDTPARWEMDGDDSSDATSQDDPENLELANVYEDIETGSGDDSIEVDRTVKDSDIATGAGDDSLVVDGAMYSSTVDTGTGDDSVELDDRFEDSTLTTGDGDDTVSVGYISEKDSSSVIDTGDGDDAVTIDNVSASFDDGSVSLGDGDDSLTISDNLVGNDATFSGGDGDDSLVLTKVSESSWESGTKDLFSGFETVTLKDGNTYSLDADNNLTLLP